MVLVPPAWIQYNLELMPAPVTTFRWFLLGLVAANCAISVFIEDVCVEVFLTRSKIANKMCPAEGRKTKAFESALRWMVSHPSWPPISGLDGLTPSSGGDSRRDHEEAEVHTKVEFQILDENEAFESLFDHKKMGQVGQELAQNSPKRL